MQSLENVSFMKLVVYASFDVCEGFGGFVAMFFVPENACYYPECLILISHATTYSSVVS